MKSIVFAHYKNGELLGYRADTLGTLVRDFPKIYPYSKEQVDIVLRGIHSTLGEKKPGLGELLEKMGAVVITSEGSCSPNIITQAEDKIYQDGQDAGAFEVRILVCPDKIYEREFDVSSASWKISSWGQYPVEEMRVWLEHPENHEVIETHYFSKVGQINLQ